MDGIQRVVLAAAIAAHQQGELDERGGCQRIADGDEGMGRLAVGGLRLGLEAVAEHVDLDLRGGLGCDDGGDGAGDEDDEDGAVEDCLVDQAITGGIGHVVADSHYGEGYGCMCGCQAEHHPSPGAGHTVDLLGDHGRKPLADEGYGEHHGGYCEGRWLPYDPDIDHHAYSDEEVGDEEGVAYKFYAAHQWRRSGDVAVEDESGKEGAQDLFESDLFCAPGSQEYEDKDEDKLCHLVGYRLEEKACQAWIEVEDGDAVGCQLAQEGEKSAGAQGSGVMDIDGSGQDEQGGYDGDDGADDGDQHGGALGDAVAGGDGVADEGVGGIHCRQEGGCQPADVEQEDAGQHTDSYRNEECQQAEEEPLAQVELEMIHVDLQSGKEHEVEESDLAEDGEAAVAGEDVEAVGAYDNARYYHADDVGYLESAEQERGKEYYPEDDQEYRHGIGG